jgi:hypothetical protein
VPPFPTCETLGETPQKGTGGTLWQRAGQDSPVESVAPGNRRQPAPRLYFTTLGSTRWVAGCPLFIAVFTVRASYLSAAAIFCA